MCKKSLQPKPLIVISFFHPHRGGAEQQALLLTSQLRRSGIAASVLTRKFPDLTGRELVNGVPVFRSIATLRWGKLFGISYFFSCLWFLLRKRHTYDIIHCYILQGFHTFAAIAMKYLCGKKVIIRISATGPLSDFLMVRRGLGGAFFLRCARKADTIITMSLASQQEALAAGFRPEQIMRISNGVDTMVFTPAPQPAASGHILFVGRLDRMKGVAVLLEALARLRESGVHCRCTVVGDGPAKEELQHLAGALALDGVVDFPGTCSDIVPRMQEASIFVLPSHSEGTPNVLLEAMACGLPIIATAVGGVPDIIQDGRNGLLIAPADSEALCSALERLHAGYDFARRLGAQARRDAEERYGLDAITGAYIDLYRTLQPHT